MSTVRITESVRLDAAPDVVWRWLIDPERVAQCLPGASLEGREGDTLLGSVRLSVGPVTVAYSGKAEFVEQDDAARRMRMTATGREEKGAGGVRMSMTGEVAEAEGGGSEVRVEAEVQLSGTIVRFGRGMIERVSQDQFRQFAVCLAERVTAGAAGGETTSPATAAGEASPVAVLPALLRAFRASVAAFFRRLGGRSR